jgi:hypothetical protein
VAAPPVLAVPLAVVRRLRLPLLLRLLQRRHRPPKPQSRSRVKVASLVRRNSKKIIMRCVTIVFSPSFCCALRHFPWQVIESVPSMPTALSFVSKGESFLLMIDRIFLCS